MESEYRITTFDPGSSRYGFSNFVIDLSAKKPLPELVECDTVYIDSFLPQYQERFPHLSLRQLRHRILRDTTSGILSDFRPHAIGCEDNYLGRFPQAFSALVECVYSYRLAIEDYTDDIPLWIVDPMTAKKVVGASKKKKGDSKSPVRDAILKTKMFKTSLDLTTRDEHAIDSSAIGTWACYHFINTVSWLFWNK